ncbi:MAG: response regulator transcription factor [Bacteroidetes bacterium]|nr:response regulator transcription factor [Bacteroidota bacterium]
MKIALLDDHKLVLQALKAQLESLPSVNEVVAWYNPHEFLSSGSIFSFDLVFLDIHFEDYNGFDVLRQLKTNNYTGKIIMLTGTATTFTLNKAIKEGANGFIGKDCEQSELEEAIAAVTEGSFYIGKSLDKLARELLLTPKNKTLSEREIEIVRLIAQGYSYKQIGEKLFISTRTVEAHRNHILEKLNLSNVTELVRFALKNHLI